MFLIQSDQETRIEYVKDSQFLNRNKNINKNNGKKQQSSVFVIACKPYTVIRAHIPRWHEPCESAFTHYMYTAKND